ncbi:hypothetical protein SprV_0602196200 [Sparganum proliferum]
MREEVYIIQSQKVALCYYVKQYSGADHYNEFVPAICSARVPTLAVAGHSSVPRRHEFYRQRVLNPNF